jgi:hypothetical protein
MISFKQYFSEAVADIAQLKRKPLAQRTPRDQAALNAAKASKPKTGKVEVHIKHEDGKVSKERFKLTKKQDKWDDEAKEIASAHLKNLQSMHDKFPSVVGSRAKEIHKVEIK